MIEEIWKDIDFTNGEYQVSNLGRIKSMQRIVKDSKGRLQPINEKLIKGWINQKGYVEVSIKGKSHKVHRLVAKAFIENLELKPSVNHIDFNKENNCLQNLEWVTNKENTHHAIVNNRIKRQIGSSHYKAKAVNQFEKNGDFVRKWDCMSDLERQMNVDRSNLIRHLQGSSRYKSVKGFKFEYA
jgi:hypothetical protein